MTKSRCEFCELYGGVPYCSDLNIQLPSTGGDRPVPYRPNNCSMSEVADSSCNMLPQRLVNSPFVQYQSEE